MQCSLCVSQFSTLPMLLKHIRLVHADRPDFNLQCNLQGCKRTFKQFSTYRNHIYQRHDLSCFETNQTEVGISAEHECNDCSVSETEFEQPESDVESEIGSSEHEATKSNCKHKHYYWGFSLYWSHLCSFKVTSMHGTYKYIIYVHRQYILRVLKTVPCSQHDVLLLEPC